MALSHPSDPSFPCLPHQTPRARIVFTTNQPTFIRNKTRSPIAKTGRVESSRCCQGLGVSPSAPMFPSQHRLGFHQQLPQHLASLPMDQHQLLSPSQANLNGPVQARVKTTGSLGERAHLGLSMCFSQWITVPRLSCPLGGMWDTSSSLQNLNLCSELSLGSRL